MLKTKLWKSIFGPIGTKDMRVQSDILGNLQTFLCSGVKIPCSKFQLWSLLFLKHICKPVNLQLSYYYFFHVMGHKALLSLRGQRGQNYFNQKTNTLFFVHSRNWRLIKIQLKMYQLLIEDMIQIKTGQHFSEGTNVLHQFVAKFMYVIFHQVSKQNKLSFKDSNKGTS